MWTASYEYCLYRVESKFNEADGGDIDGGGGGKGERVPGGKFQFSHANLMSSETPDQWRLSGIMEENFSTFTYLISL